MGSSPTGGTQPTLRLARIRFVDRLTEVAKTTRLGDYVASYPSPAGSGISLEDAVSAVREVHDAS